MRFLHLLWKKYTLLCILTLTGLPLTILGWTGRNGLYKDLALTPLTQPGLTLVMEGIHEGIYPWGDLFERGKKEDASQEASTEEGAALIAAEAVSDEAVTAGTASTAGSGTASGAASGTGATTASGAAEGTTAGAAAGASSAEASSAGSTIQYTEAEDSEVKEVKTIPEGAITGDPNTIPEGVCNPVMQAEDYDVVNVAFLSPDDTEYNTDTEGIFAKNGIYFRLQEVDPTYFADALFIGDSRTVGLCEYGSFKENAAFLAKESINVYNVQDKQLWFTDHDGEGWDYTVEDALDYEQYGKIYVALGVNELGIGNSYMFYEKYRELLELIRERQPNALIYIQGIMHVSEEKSSSDSCRNNTVICQRNYAISTLANGRDIFYIDMNPYVCDANGDLIEDLSGDGIHLKASAYERWDRSLLENAAVVGE